MTYRRTYDPTNRAEVFATLRREILAARLKVTLDEELDRTTSPKVKLLAQMKLPPRVLPYHPVEVRLVAGLMTRRTKIRCSPRCAVRSSQHG